MPVVAIVSWILFAQEDFGGDFGNAGGNAELRPEDIGAMIGVLVVYGVIFLVAISIRAYLMYLNYSALAVIPQQYRTLEPWQVFLLFIPCFDIIWRFFVTQKTSESFRNYFQAQGDYSRGDCGGGVGLWFAIMAACCNIPYLNCLFVIPALVLLIMYLVKITELKGVVASGVLGLSTNPYGGQMGYYAGDPKNPYANPGQYPPKY